MGFPTVIAGVDGTRAGFEAVRQAARLTAADGRLVLVAAADPYLAMFNRWGPSSLVEAPDPARVTIEDARRRLEQAAAASLLAARSQVAHVAAVETRLVSARAWEALRDAASADGAVLIAAGTHGTGRMSGIASGSTATELLHEAPCSVLVARPPFDPAGFPASVVVGVDGSAASLAAARLARDLADGRARALVAGGRAGHGAEAAARAEGLAVEATGRRPVDALLDASRTVDLLVVGARGLTGTRALGSVSERVAHRAECSVLVVRIP